MIKGIFITGTDTGVGKTFLAAGIVRALRAQGIDVGVMKPVETGCRIRDGKLIPKDAMTLMRSAAVKDPLDLVNPYRFQAPLAPMVAAQHEGITIEIRKIKEAFRLLAKRHEFMVVEGAGGIMVPLSLRYSYLDMAADMGLPVLIVARPGLGTINHTLMTIAMLKNRGVKVSGIVINHAIDRKEGLAEKTSPDVIKIISGVDIIGIVKFRSRRFGAIIPQLLPR
jgi:dethiobiotin synthetase